MSKGKQPLQPGTEEEFAARYGTRREENRGRARKRRGKAEVAIDGEDTPTTTMPPLSSASTLSTAAPVIAAAPVEPLEPIELLEQFKENVNALVNLPIIAPIQSEINRLLGMQQQLFNNIHALEEELRNQIATPHVEGQMRLEQTYDRLNNEWQVLRANIVALNGRIDEVSEDIAAYNAALARQYDECARQADEIRERRNTFDASDKAFAKQKLEEWQDRSRDIRNSIAAYGHLVRNNNRLQHEDTLGQLKDQIEQPAPPPAPQPANSLFTMLQNSRDAVRGQWITNAELRDMQRESQAIDSRALPPSAGVGVGTNDEDARSRNIAQNSKAILAIQGRISAITAPLPPPPSREVALLLDTRRDDEPEEEKELSISGSISDDDDFILVDKTERAKKEVAPEEMSLAEVEKAADALNKKTEATDKQIAALTKEIAKLDAEAKAINVAVGKLNAPSSESRADLDQRDRLAIRERKSLDERYKAAQKQMLELAEEQKRLMVQAGKNEKEYGSLREQLLAQIGGLAQKQLDLNGRPAAPKDRPPSTTSRAQLMQLGNQMQEDKKAIEVQIARIDAHRAAIQVNPGQIARTVIPGEVADPDALQAQRQTLLGSQQALNEQEAAYKLAMNELEREEKKIEKDVTRLKALQDRLDKSLTTRLEQLEADENPRKGQTDRLSELQMDNIAPLAASLGVDLNAVGGPSKGRGDIGEAIDDLKSAAETEKGVEGFFKREWAKFEARVNMHRHIEKENGSSWDTWNPNPVAIGKKYKEDFDWLRKVGFPVNAFAWLLIICFTIVGSIARMANAILTVAGAVVELGCRMAAKGLNKAGWLLSKPLELVSKQIAIADKEGKVGALVGWRALAVLCFIPQAIGSACNISSVALRTTGDLVFEASALAGKAAVLASRPWSKEVWVSTAFSVGKVVSVGVSVASGVTKQVGTELRDVGNKTNIPVIKQIFSLTGTVAQSTAVALEGGVESVRQYASGHKDMAKEVGMTGVRTAWDNLKSAFKGDQQEVAATAGESTGLTHKHLIKESREIKQGEELSKLTKRQAPAPDLEAEIGRKSSKPSLSGEDESTLRNALSGLRQGKTPSTGSEAEHVGTGEGKQRTTNPEVRRSRSPSASSGGSFMDL